MDMACPAATFFNRNLFNHIALQKISQRKNTPSRNRITAQCTDHLKEM